jgi:hypothetical protein
MALRPLEILSNEICKNCKQQGRKIVDFSHMAGKSGPEQDGNETEVARAPMGMPEEKAEVAKDRVTSEEVLCFGDYESDGDGGAKNQMKDPHTQKEDTTEVLRRESSKTSKDETSVEIGTEVSDKAPKPKTSLAQNEWINVEREPDWDMITSEEAKDLLVEEAVHGEETEADAEANARNVPTSMVEDPSSKDKERSDWEVINGEQKEEEEGERRR